MKITAADMVDLKIVDGVIPEPVGGAHRAPEGVFAAAGDVMARALRELSGLTREEVRRARREKFLALGRSLA
jgi:acetyl-CoA carboxylase carboxyl transferase subunit alpha